MALAVAACRAGAGPGAHHIAPARLRQLLADVEVGDRGQDVRAAEAVDMRYAENASEPKACMHHRKIILFVASSSSWPPTALRGGGGGQSQTTRDWSRTFSYLIWLRVLGHRGYTHPDELVMLLCTTDEMRPD